MNFLDFCVRKPVAILVILIIFVLFGFISLGQLPTKLTPNVTKPKISIFTSYPGANAYEIEKEIIQKQEDVLKSITNLISYESSSRDDGARITLTFKIGADLKEARFDVLNKLSQIKSYPQNVKNPIIRASGDDESPIVWSALKLKNKSDKNIYEYLTFFEDEIQGQIERIPGVSSLFIIGGRQEMLYINLDYDKLLSLNISINDIINKIKNENIDISAGSLDIGRKTYRVRTKAYLNDIKSIENLTFINDFGKIVKFSDFATIYFGYEKPSSISMVDEDEAIMIAIRPTSNANIVETTNLIEKEYEKINQNLSKNNLELVWLRDDRSYVINAINLVKENILVGGFLAIAVLMLFLRSFYATAIISICIPISIISTFIVFLMLERSLNIISLAGISFAVGMLIDSAIVVLENIYRHKNMGKNKFQAAIDATKEVWGALVASSLTTIAVFVPIIFLEDEAGLLFKDIAIAVTSAVSFSLFISIIAIPMFYALFAKDKKQKNQSLSQKFGNYIVIKIMNLINLVLKNKLTSLSCIVILTSLSIFSIYILFPKMEYLPSGNKNFILNLFIPPPGISYNERYEIGKKIFEKLNSKEFSEVKNAFFSSRGSFMMLGVSAKNTKNIQKLISQLKPLVNSFAGIKAISIQAGLFERGLGRGRNVEIDINAQNLDDILKAANTIHDEIKKSLPNLQIKANPSLQMQFLEANFIPDRENLNALNLSSKNLADVINVLNDGANISEFKKQGTKSIDMILQTTNSLNTTPEKILNSQIRVNDKLVSIKTLANLQISTGLNEIIHVDGKRTISLQISPPKNITIEEITSKIKDEILPTLTNQGLLKNININISGTSESLKQIIEIMKKNLILALLITYLLTSALFGNFLYPLVIMMSIPIALAGGFMGLSLTNTFISYQPLDVLTMLGFIILIGIVVNNSILIVHQSLNNIRFHDKEHKTAIIEATKSRLRPIFMSSLTSVFGMLPLVIFSGSGSEFYKGLGSVIAGGLTLSTFFSIFITPAMLIFFVKFEKNNN